MQQHTRLNAMVDDVVVSNGLQVRVPGHGDADLGYHGDTIPDIQSIRDRCTSNIKTFHPIQHVWEGQHAASDLTVMQFNIENRRTTDPLLWNQRKWRLLGIMLANTPDIIALEGCDRFADFFYPALRAFGYQGVCNYRKGGGFSHQRLSPGCALFWKNERFELFEDLSTYIKTTRWNQTTELNEDIPNYPLTFVHLVDKNRQNKELYVAVCHLKGSQGKRDEQMQSILNHVEGKKKGPSNYFLLLGDLNTTQKPRLHEKELVSAYRHSSRWSTRQTTDHIFYNKKHFQLMGLLQKATTSDYPAEHAAKAAALNYTH